MKTKSAMAGLTMMLAIFTSCEKETIRVSGEVIRTEVILRDYSGLKVANAINVHVSFSEDEERIIVEANEDIQDKILVFKDGNILIVKLQKFVNIRGNATMNVFITTNNINFFDVSGASKITLDNALPEQQNTRIELSGAARFSGEVSVNTLDVDASGASDADLYGQVKLLTAKLSGASTLKEYDLEVDDLDMRLSGASTAFLTVTNSLNIRASGASVLNYKGEAVIENKDLSGASEIIRRD